MHRVVQRPAIHDVERRQSRIVVVEPDASRAGAFQQRAQLLRPEAVRKVDARLVARVFKLNRLPLRAAVQSEARAREPKCERSCAEAPSIGDEERSKQGKRRKRFIISFASRRAGLVASADALRSNPRALSCATAPPGRDSPRTVRAGVTANAVTLFAAANPEPAVFLARTTDPNASSSANRIARSAGVRTKKEPSRSTGAVPITTAWPSASIVSSRTCAGAVFKIAFARIAARRAPSCRIAPVVQPRGMPLGPRPRRHDHRLNKIRARLHRFQHSSSAFLPAPGRHNFSA